MFEFIEENLDDIMSFRLNCAFPKQMSEKPIRMDRWNHFHWNIWNPPLEQEEFEEEMSIPVE